MKIKPNHLDLPFLPVRQTALDSRVKQMEQIRRKISHQTIENGAEAYAHKSLVNRIKAYLR